MLDVAVVALAVVGLATLALIAAISLNIYLSLYLVPLTIAIYPPLPEPYRLYLDLNLDLVLVPVPFLDLHKISDRPISLPFLRFANGLVFLSRGTNHTV